MTTRIGLATLGVVVVLTASVGALTISWADPPLPLSDWREQLSDFETLYSPLTYGGCAGSGLHGDRSCDAVLRLDRSSGRATFDLSPQIRVSWDGAHAWLDYGPGGSATAMGDDADVVVGTLVSEIFSGFENSEVELQDAEEWLPWSRMGKAHRVDFPGNWDDDLAILVFAGDGALANSASFFVLDANNGEVLHVPLFDIDLRFAAPMQLNVRLEADLGTKESIMERQEAATYDTFGGVKTFTGPAFVPPYHELSTRLDLAFAAGLSAGAVVGGVERPFVQLGPVTCPSGGATTTVPIDLEFAVLAADPYFEYYSAAETEGCPFRFGLAVGYQFSVGTNATGVIQGNLHLMEGTQTKASQAFSKAFTGTHQENSEFLHVWTTTDHFDAEDMRISIQGTLVRTCSGASSQPTTLRIGAVEVRRPTAAWDGCFPEYDTFPTTDTPRPLYPDVSPSED